MRVVAAVAPLLSVTVSVMMKVSSQALTWVGVGTVYVVVGVSSSQFQV